MSDFQTLFGRPPIVTADAPGRVNLIGEHTDYNGGFVLPTAIPQQTHVELAPRSDQTVRVWSSSQEKNANILTYELGAERPGRKWLDYIQGVTQILRTDGHRLSGFEARITSQVPLGSGLSSSASLTVSLMRALRRAFGLTLDDVPIALLGQRAENEFVGAHLVVLNSGVAHDHAAGDYNTRRAECERACALLGVRQLRDLTAADLPRLNALPEPLNRRARHVVTENDRVVAAAAAIRAGDIIYLGELFYASQVSMRDD
jgi:galactokinase